MPVWVWVLVCVLSCLLVVIDYPAALSAVSRVVSVCRFAHPHSLEILDNSAGEKKDSRMSPFLPLCVQHSKGFPPGIVQARLESGKRPNHYATSPFS